MSEVLKHRIKELEAMITATKSAMEHSDDSSTISSDRVNLSSLYSELNEVRLSLIKATDYRDVDENDRLRKIEMMVCEYFPQEVKNEVSFYIESLMRDVSKMKGTYEAYRDCNSTKNSLKIQLMGVKAEYKLLADYVEEKYGEKIDDDIFKTIGKFVQK